MEFWMFWVLGGAAVIASMIEQKSVNALGYAMLFVCFGIPGFGLAVALAANKVRRAVMAA